MSQLSSSSIIHSSATNSSSYNSALAPALKSEVDNQIRKLLIDFAEERGQISAKKAQLEPKTITLEHATQHLQELQSKLDKMKTSILDMRDKGSLFSKTVKEHLELGGVSVDKGKAYKELSEHFQALIPLKQEEGRLIALIKETSNKIESLKLEIQEIRQSLSQDNEQLDALNLANELVMKMNQNVKVSIRTSSSKISEKLKNIFSRIQEAFIKKQTSAHLENHKALLSQKQVNFKTAEIEQQTLRAQKELTDHQITDSQEELKFLVGMVFQNNLPDKTSSQNIDLDIRQKIDTLRQKIDVYEKTKTQLISGKALLQEKKILIEKIDEISPIIENLRVEISATEHAISSLQIEQEAAALIVTKIEHIMKEIEHSSRSRINFSISSRTPSSSRTLSSSSSSLSIPSSSLSSSSSSLSSSSSSLSSSSSSLSSSSSSLRSPSNSSKSPASNSSSNSVSSPKRAKAKVLHHGVVMVDKVLPALSENDFKLYPLHYLIISESNEKIIEYLKNMPREQFNAAVKEVVTGWPVTALALRFGKFTAFLEIIERGGNLNLKNELANGWNLAQIMAYAPLVQSHGEIEKVITCLSKAGISFTEMNQVGPSPISRFAYRGKVNIMNHLIDKYGVNPNHIECGFSLLHYLTFATVYKEGKMRTDSANKNLKRRLDLLTDEFTLFLNRFDVDQNIVDTTNRERTFLHYACIEVCSVVIEAVLKQERESAGASPTTLSSSSSSSFSKSYSSSSSLSSRPSRGRSSVSSRPRIDLIRLDRFGRVASQYLLEDLSSNGFSSSKDKGLRRELYNLLESFGAIPGEGGE